jgi:hypothetical protein
VYELSPSGSGWNETFLHQFMNESDGGGPTSLVIDSNGNLYGATQYGGVEEGGTIYELIHSGGSWSFQLLFSLMGTSGSPSLVRDRAGDLYGSNAPGMYGFGAVFKLTESHGSWFYTSLHDFTGGNDGAGVSGTLLVDGSGNVYGTSPGGGVYGNGVAFEITP